MFCSSLIIFPLHLFLSFSLWLFQAEENILLNFHQIQATLPEISQMHLCTDIHDHLSIFCLTHFILSISYVHELSSIFLYKLSYSLSILAIYFFFLVLTSTVYFVLNSLNSLKDSNWTFYKCDFLFEIQIPPAKWLFSTLVYKLFLITHAWNMHHISCIKWKRGI